MYGTTKDELATTLQEIKDAGLWKSERQLTSPQSAHVTTNRAEALNFCANNYLGLADHPEVERAAAEALREWGFGMASVRFICGTQSQHKALEAALSDFLGTEDTILYSSCFDANGGVFEVLFGAEDAIISDELNHASLIDGIRLSKARRFRYKNPEHFGVMDRVDILSGTLGKALGGASGGYISAHQEIVDLLRQRSRPYLFSNAVAPSVVAGSLKALEIARDSAEPRKVLQRNAELFRRLMTEAGFELLPGEHAIIPVMFPGEDGAREAGQVADAMLERGVYVIPFSYPVVPQGRARIRVQLSAAHSEDDVRSCVEAFVAAREEIGVRPAAPQG